MRVYDDRGRLYPYIEQGDVIRVERERLGTDIEFLELDFEEYTAAVGEEGYYLIGDVEHSGSRLCRFTEKAEGEFLLRQELLPLFGVKKAGLCRLIVCEGMRFDFYVRIGLKDGNFYIRAHIKLHGDLPSEDPSFRIFTLSPMAGYSEMAAAYRNRRLQTGCRLLSERAGERSALSYAAEAPEIRIRMGWKPVPTPILEQTIATEPPMHVACTFARVCDLIDELKAQGVDRAELCLVGWNQSGHDGRYPDLFPVEERLGGEAGLRQLIAYAQANGYRIVCHTNSTDCYRIAKSFSVDDVIKSKEGELQHGTLAWSGGQKYLLCPTVAYRQALKVLPRVRALGFRGLHYIDVMSTVSPHKCYDPQHPVTSQVCTAYWERIGRLAAEQFGGFASEGGFDHAAAYLDSALYVVSKSNQNAFFDAEVPFWQLVYHGIILSNPSTETINYPIKGEAAHLHFLEYGGRPTFYIYSKFITNHEHENWLGKQDLLIDTAEDLKATAAVIRDAYREYQRLSYLQYLPMERHEIAGKVHTVTYADGSRIVVDHASGSWQLISGE